jgi:hypothetical protein
VGRTGEEATGDAATGEPGTEEGERPGTATGLADSEAKTAAQQRKEARTTTKKYRKNFIPEKHTIT